MGETRGAYAGRERARLTKAHLRRAKGLIADDSLQGRGFDFADTECKGLVLRVTRRSGAWLLKHRSGTVRLGDMDALPVEAARVAAERARLVVLDGRNPTFDLAVFEEATRRRVRPGVAIDAAFPLVLPEQSSGDRRRDGPWEWNDLVDEFLAVKLPKLRPRWAVQYERHLRRSCIKELERRLVCAVTQADLLALRDRIAKERTLSAAADTIEAVQAAMSWGKQFHGHLTRLSGYPWWNEEVAVDWSSTPREHTPRLDELARTLILAERYRALSGTGKETSNGLLAALWAAVLTGQRAGALTGTLRATTRSWPDRPGWQVWTWTAMEMKGGKAPRPHAVPVPPEALATLARFPVDPQSRFLFPSRVPDKSVTAVGLTQLLDRMQGKAKKGRNGNVTLRPEANLLAANDIRPWTPHDVRRTMTDYLDLERLGGAASAILAHKAPTPKGERDQERELAQAITLKHYLHSQRLSLKADGMEAWVHAILGAYEAERASLVPVDGRQP